MRRLFGASAEALIIVILVIGLMAVPVLGARGGGGGGGGKPSGGGSGSLALVMVNDADADGVVSHGDSITFTVTTTADRPYVSVKCSQGGTLVYAALGLTRRPQRVINLDAEFLRNVKFVAQFTHITNAHC